MDKKCNHVWVFDKLVPANNGKKTKHKHHIQYKCSVCKVTRIDKPVNREFFSGEQEDLKNGN